MVIGKELNLRIFFIRLKFGICNLTLLAESELHKIILNIFSKGNCSK